MYWFVGSGAVQTFPQAFVAGPVHACVMGVVSQRSFQRHHAAFPSITLILRARPPFRCAGPTPHSSTVAQLDEHGAHPSPLWIVVSLGDNDDDDDDDDDDDGVAGVVGCDVGGAERGGGDGDETELH